MSGARRLVAAEQAIPARHPSPPRPPTQERGGEPVMTIAIVGLGLAVLTLILVALVIVGTQRDALDSKPPTPLAGFARRVLGLHVRKPPTDRTPSVNPRSADSSSEALTSLSPRR
jgi:hypothetical protein